MERRRERAERRRTRPPAARFMAPDSGRLGRRIGPAWLTISQLCRRWQLDRKTIYKFIDANILTAWKVGSHLYRVAAEEVLRFEGRNRLPAVPSGRRVSVPPEE